MAKQIDEALKSCAACKKAVKKVRRFYRNGKYYCNQNCWRKSQSGAKSESEGA
jgi:hypothetical protein